MLQSIRDRAKGWLAWIVVILICIPFALWGIQEYFGPSGDVAVAEVNGAELTLRQLQNAHQQQRARLQRLLGQGFDVSLLDEDELRRQTLERLVREELILQASLRDGLRVGDEQLAQAIHDQEFFRRDGQFSQTLYEQWLRARGYTPGSFELDYRRSLVAEQIALAVSQSAIVTESDVKRVLRLTNQRRTYSQLIVPLERFRDVEISEDAIEQYYAANRPRFVTPEQVSVEYVELNRDSIAAGIQVEESELLSFFEAEKANYVVPEQRRASHILVALEEGADDTAKEAALERLEEIQSRLDEGESFESLAEEFSDDPGSATRGGDLGFFGRGVMDSRFEEAAYTMEVGETSGRVRTKFGYHLIKLTEVQPAKAKSFEEARDSVLRAYRQRQAEQLFFEQAEQFANLAFEQPHSLEPVAEALGLKIQETGFFARKGPDAPALLRDPKVLNAVFSAEVLEERNNSEAIELAGSRVVVVRVKERRPEAQQVLEAVRDEIEEVLKGQAARKEARSVGMQLLHRLRSGEDRQSVASAYDLNWTEMGPLRRDAEMADRQVLEAVFRVPRPMDGTTSYDALETSSGDFVVIALHAIEHGGTAEIDEEERNSAQRTLATDYGQRDYQAFVQALRSSAEVVIHEDAL